MWYRYSRIKFAATREEILRQQTPPPDDEVIQYIVDPEKEEDHQKYLTNAYFKNRNITLQDLQRIQPPASPYTDYERQAVAGFAPIFQKWALAQLRQIRKQISSAAGQVEYTYPGGWDATLATLTRIAHWADAQLIDLSAYNFQTATDDTQKWEQSGQKRKPRYEQTNPQNVVYGPTWSNPKWQGWTIQLVNTMNDLEAEGYNNDNCIGNVYRESCLPGGDYRIYSLRDPQNNPHVSLRFDGKEYRMQEARGGSNSEPKPNYKAMVKEWLSTVPGATSMLDNVITVDRLFPRINEQGLRRKMLVQSRPEDVDRILQRFNENDYDLPGPLNDPNANPPLDEDYGIPREYQVRDVVQPRRNAPPQEMMEKSRIYNYQKPPAEVLMDNVHEQYNDILNAAYDRVRQDRQNPDEYYRWLDAVANALVTLAKNKDINILKREIQSSQKYPGGLKPVIFRYKSNLLRLHELLSQLRAKDPPVMQGAPRRQAFRNYEEYKRALTRFLGNQGYGAPAFFPNTQMISYDINKAIWDQLTKAKNDPELQTLIEQINAIP